MGPSILRCVDSAPSGPVGPGWCATGSNRSNRPKERLEASAPSIPPLFSADVPFCVCAAVLRYLCGNMSQTTLDELTCSTAKLHERCFELFCELTEARMRIAELEGVVGAMKYAMTDAMQDSEQHPPTTTTIDYEQCSLCATDAFSDA